MAVIACPKCPTQLRIPDGASGNVRCPKCAHIFPTSAPKPAFEVVDATPAPKPPPPPPKKVVVAGESDDFEVIDEKPRQRRRDEDDDRPRGRSRRRDDDDDDYDDRPRRKRRNRRDEYDDEDDWQPRKKRGNPLATAKTAAQLLSVGFWLYVGAFGLMALFVLIGWAGGDVPGGLMAIAGLVGLGNWIVSLVGLGFAIAGPERARGMAIAATVVSAVHLVLCGVIYSNVSDGFGALGAFGVKGGSAAAWAVFSSVLPVLDAALPVLVYNSKSFGGDFLVAFLAAACELARFILILLLLKELALAARDGGTADKAVGGVMTVSGVCGGAAVLALLVVVLIYEGKLMRSAVDLASASFLLIYVGYTVMTIFPALCAQDTRAACARRS